MNKVMREENTEEIEYKYKDENDKDPEKKITYVRRVKYNACCDLCGQCIYDYHERYENDELAYSDEVESFNQAVKRKCIKIESYKRITENQVDSKLLCDNCIEKIHKELDTYLSDKYGFKLI